PQHRARWVPGRHRTDARRLRAGVRVSDWSDGPSRCRVYASGRAASAGAPGNQSSTQNDPPSPHPPYPPFPAEDGRLKRRGVHPLLALQLRRAGLDVESADRLDAAAVRHLLEQVDRTYAETDQAMLNVQMAERRASRELAELYRQLRLEHGELEAMARQRAAELALSQAELAKTQRLASMGNWQYLPQLRRLEVSEELARLLELDGDLACAGP